MAQKKIGHIELQWTCPNCGGINPGPDKHCGNCGALQPEDVEFEQASRQDLIEDDEKIAKAEAGADIHCPFCGSRNSANAEQCHKCGGDLTEGVKRQSGRVVGAFKTGPETLVRCPNCGTENPDTATMCSQCGGSLAADEPEYPQPDAAVTPSNGFFRTRILIIAAVAAVLIIACGLYLIFANRTNPSTGVVNNISWERSVPVEALVPVEYQTWQDEIPTEGVIGNCSEEVHSIQNEPAANSVEICGTPYSVDTGGGFADVVQDCTYEVYETYCTYTLEEWSVVEVARLTGSDFSPVWPEPVLDAAQRMGDEWTENFTIVFNSGDTTYTYTTHDLDLFQQAQIGSEWTLNVNTFGQLMSIEN